MTAIRPNIITSISGKPKSGKTHLAMTFEDPIKVYSFDLGATFVRTKFPDKQIDIHEFILPIIEEDPPPPFAQPIWKEFYDEYKKDVYGGKYKTVVLDTATAVWFILRQAITEEKNRKKLLEVEYYLPNTKMSTLFAHARVAGVNLVTLQYLKSKYVKGDDTGELIPDGWSWTEGQADVVLEIAAKDTGNSHKMVTTLVKNRFDRNLNDQTFVDMTYDDLMVVLEI